MSPAVPSSRPARPTRPSDVFLGRVVDERFEVQSFLGEGAVGAVYRARDRNDGRPVALKIWNGTVLNEQTSGRFAREATALSTLRHPNIVDVRGYGLVDGLPYVAMEYLQGNTLEDLLGQGEPLDPAIAFDIAQQMLAALAYAHGLGVVHRDLKPDNVFVSRAEHGGRVVKLLDYGLAKFLSPDDDPVKATLTMTGVVMGTPLYMPPEQAAGKVVDVRVDVYAAGCVIFELLSGMPPFLGESNGELLRAHMLSPVPKLAEARRELQVAPAVQDFIERALAKLPDKRFANASQMLLALQALPQPWVSRKSSARVEPHFQAVSAPAAASSLPAPPAARGSLVPVLAGAALGLCVLAVLALLLR